MSGSVPWTTLLTSVLHPSGSLPTLGRPPDGRFPRKVLRRQRSSEHRRSRVLWPAGSVRASAVCFRVLGLFNELRARLSERVEYRANLRRVPDLAILGKVGLEDYPRKLRKPKLGCRFREAGDPGGEQAIAWEA